MIFSNTKYLSRQKFEIWFIPKSVGRNKNLFVFYTFKITKYFTRSWRRNNTETIDRFILSRVGVLNTVLTFELHHNAIFFGEVHFEGDILFVLEPIQLKRYKHLRYTYY